MTDKHYIILLFTLNLFFIYKWLVVKHKYKITHSLLLLEERHTQKLSELNIKLHQRCSKYIYLANENNNRLLTENEINTLIYHCDPDKHNNSVESKNIFNKLLELKKDTPINVTH